MNQSELISKVAFEAGLSKSESEKSLKALGAITQVALANGDEIALPGIGKFSAKTRAARTGRNPATGEEMQIAAKQVPHFSAAKALKDAVAG
ncbi:MAG TPA: integration host factor subunit alpha [Methylophilaceae bacterium]|nr:integration host factor subunit alpha [Methylophilaceae bacterium]